MYYAKKKLSKDLTYHESFYRRASWISTNLQTILGICADKLKRRKGVSTVNFNLYYLYASS